MKGNNELVLNEATMIVALQEYINKRIILDTPKVASLKYKNETFILLLQEGDTNENKPNT